MNERIKELWNEAASATAAYPSGENNSWETQINFMEKFAELIVQDYSKKTIQGLMSDPAFAQAMDEYYEQKWAHRFD